MTPAKFLQAFRPSGPWLITAIAQGSAPISRYATTPADVDSFVEMHAGKDLYFNPADVTGAPASGKASKADMAGSWWQWVDLDPPKGADLEAWRADAVTRLKAALPTMIVDSGRGFWGFWKRPEYSSDHAEIEGVNRALADALGADHCWNVDRLARLPGTVNSKTGCTAAVIDWTPGPATLPAPVNTSAAATATDWPTGPCEGATLIADDEELVAKARASRSAAAASGDGVSFDDLWTGNAAKLAERWPAKKAGDPYDRSAADAALAAHLAFWTGRDCERIPRLMKLSQLVRPKWDRDDYLGRTVTGQCARVQQVYQDPSARRAAQLTENAHIGAEVVEPALPTVMTLVDMRKRLVFIGSSGAVVDSATRRVRKKDAASDEYAASVHHYTDPDTGKAKSMPALKAWIASGDRITADVLAWVPGALPICRPPEIIDGGTRAFNTWRGFAPMSAPDDWQERAAPFVEHLAYLVPNDAERSRFTQWLAHMIRAPEVLPHTAYLMVTTQTGIGRNALASVLVRVLRGYVAAGVDIAAILDGRFNGWLSQKLLAIVDEIREGLGERRYQRGERLKSLITEEHRQIDIKYGLQSVEKNSCRWLMFSNFFDALPFENTDRRIVVVANPTERRPPDYYARLYAVIEDPAFIASVRAYLDAVDLSDFRPGEHAPVNDAKAKALDAMMSDTDRAVADYRDTYTGLQLTTRDSIRAFVEMNSQTRPAANHLTKAIDRAGMMSTGKRVKIEGKAHSVVIVRGDWTPESVKSASPEQIVSVITGSPGSPGSPV
jgi:primase-polymerase (primpol)-like protein